MVNLTDEQIKRILEEARRVLKPGGTSRALRIQPDSDRGGPVIGLLKIEDDTCPFNFGQAGRLFAGSTYRAAKPLSRSTVIASL